MKHIWQEDLYDRRIDGAPRKDESRLWDGLCEAVLVLSALYFGAHVIAWWLR